MLSHMCSLFSLFIEPMQLLLIQKVILREKVISYHNVMYNVLLFCRGFRDGE